MIFDLDTSDGRAASRLDAVEIGAGAIGSGAPVKTLSLFLLYPGHLLTDHRPYGDGLIAYGFIAELARRGHRLAIAAQQVDVRRELPDNVTIYPLGAGATSGIIERCMFLFRTRRLFNRLRAGTDIDIVHQLNPVCNGMILGMWGVKQPIVLGTFVASWPADAERLTGRVNHLSTLPARLVRAVLLPLQERLAAAFLVTTEAAMSRFSAPAKVAERVYPLRHGIDAGEFTPLPLAPDAQQTVLFFTSVTVKKGIFTLLDAFETVHAVLPDARLIVAGIGSALDDVRRRVTNMRGGNRVTLLGHVGRDAVPELMARAGIYCLPSYGEPYATTVIEAMACGKAVVVTDSGGLRDMVSDEGGRRVEPRNAKALAAALVELLASPTLQATMGRHNRRVAERDYDWPRVVDALERIYGSVLERHAVGAPDASLPRAAQR